MRLSAPIFLLCAAALAATGGTAVAGVEGPDPLLAPSSRYPGQSELRAPLDRSAGLKSRDMLRCDQFDHGTGSAGTPRSIFAAWLGSSGHRHNILGPYRDLGVGLRIGTLGDFHDARIWTQHFGAHC